MNDPANKISGDLFDSRPLEGQHAIVTGASRGIGAAIGGGKEVTITIFDTKAR